MLRVGLVALVTHVQMLSFTFLARVQVQRLSNQTGLALALSLCGDGDVNDGVELWTDLNSGVY